MLNFSPGPYLAEKILRVYKHTFFGDGRRVVLLRRVLSLGLFAGLLLSRNLWLSDRSYPLTPVYQKLPDIPPPLDYILYISLLGLLVTIAFAARPFKWIAVSLLLAILLGMTDQSRWQPWFYQYIVMLAAVCFHTRGNADADEQKTLLNTCRLIVACVYFWSGVQKLNVSFSDGVLPWIIGPYLRFIFGGGYYLPRWVIISVPIIEILIGIGLLTKKCRNISALLALSTHVVILLLFIPIKRNSVVWPWNVAMASFAVILFWQAKNFSIRDVLLPRGPGIQTVAMILFGVMPLFSFFNLWDSYLSSSLYSVNIASAHRSIDQSTKERLPPGMQTYARPGQSTSQFLIDPNSWSFAELNVPNYPEDRIFINITRRICSFTETPSEVKLMIYGRPNWLNGHRQTYNYTCSDL